MMTLPPTADDVLNFIDTFAGQENTAEEVRDFVQTAARYIEQGKTLTEWRENDMLAMFIEWCDEAARAEAITYDREGPR